MNMRSMKSSAIVATATSLALFAAGGANAQLEQFYDNISGGYEGPDPNCASYDSIGAYLSAEVYYTKHPANHWQKPAFSGSGKSSKYGPLDTEPELQGTSRFANLFAPADWGQWNVPCKNPSNVPSQDKPIVCSPNFLIPWTNDRMLVCIIVDDKCSKKPAGGSPAKDFSEPAIPGDPSLLTSTGVHAETGTKLYNPLQYHADKAFEEFDWSNVEPFSYGDFSEGDFDLDSVSSEALSSTDTLALWGSVWKGTPAAINKWLDSGYNTNMDNVGPLGTRVAELQDATNAVNEQFEKEELWNWMGGEPSIVGRQWWEYKAGSPAAKFDSLCGDRFVVFSGSDDKNDWINSDFRFAPVYNGMNTDWHIGIFDEAKQWFAYIKTWAVPTGDYKTIFAGHSLGGGVAQVAATFYKFIGYTNEVHYFGVGSASAVHNTPTASNSIWATIPAHRWVNFGCTECDAENGRARIYTADMVPMLKDLTLDFNDLNTSASNFGDAIHGYLQEVVPSLPKKIDIHLLQNAKYPDNKVHRNDRCIWTNTVYTTLHTRYSELKVSVRPLISWTPPLQGPFTPSYPMTVKSLIDAVSTDFWQGDGLMTPCMDTRFAELGHLHSAMNYNEWITYMSSQYLINGKEPKSSPYWLNEADNFIPGPIKPKNKQGKSMQQIGPI